MILAYVDLVFKKGKSLCFEKRYALMDYEDIAGETRKLR